MEPTMPDDRPKSDADDLLAVQALLYAGGALPPAEARAFEVLLSQDQKAREALGLAARVVHSAGPDDAAVLPDAAYRRRLRARFAPRPALWSWLSRRRTYPGHPAVWSALGATAAAVLLFALLRAFWVAPVAQTPPPTTPVPVQEAQAQLPAEVVETPSDLEEARIWAELPRGEHLLKTHAEESQRRARADRLARLVSLEESRARAQNPTTKH
jgi:hypothetical protein